MARLRVFDEADVLDRAMDVFWQDGYDGASVSELAKAMGITSTSIYAAFGSKRRLFDTVLARYRARRLSHGTWLLAGETAREVAERMLFGAIDWLTDPKNRLGAGGGRPPATHRSGGARAVFTHDLFGPRRAGSRRVPKIDLQRPAELALANWPIGR